MSRKPTAWDRPEDDPPREGPRTRAAVNAAGNAFRAGKNWRVAVRTAIGTWEGALPPAPDCLADLRALAETHPGNGVVLASLLHLRAVLDYVEQLEGPRHG
jgi:hypothetical protein